MARKELAMKVEQKYESTLRIAYHALRTLPGAYVTSPLGINLWLNAGCLLYTSDAADDTASV